MKKFLVATAIVFASLIETSAFAGVAARLLYTRNPIPDVTGAVSVYILVYTGGLVTRLDCTKGTPSCRSRAVETLSSSEMQHIESLLVLAKSGAIVLDQGASCQIVATYKESFVGNNGSIFLQTNTGCQNPTINNSPAARELVSIMSDLFAYSNNM